MAPSEVRDGGREGEVDLGGRWWIAEGRVTLMRPSSKNGVKVFYKSS